MSEQPITTGPAPYSDVPAMETLTQHMMTGGQRRGSLGSMGDGGSILDFFRPLERSAIESDDEDSDHIDQYVDQHTPLLQSLRDPTNVTSFTLSGNPDLISSYGNSRRGSLANLKRMRSHNTIKHVISTGHLPETETTLKNELKVVGKYSVPLVITFLLQYSLNVASVFSVGRIGKTELAAVSLAGMTANITGYCLFQGTSTSLDTLCAQAYGRRDYRTVGLHFLRCTIFLACLCVVVVLVWVFASAPILTLLVDDPRLIQMASTYLAILAIGLPAFIIFETLKRFLQAQNIFHASTYVILVAAPFNAFLNYYLVWRGPKMGFIGAPIAIVCTNYLMATFLTLYTVYVDGYQCWCGFSKDVFRNWGRMLNLSMNGCISVLSEWLAFEIFTLSAARFGTATLATQSVLTTISVLCYQVPFAVSIAASTRVANYIGGASKKSVIIAANASVILSLIIGCLNGLILDTFKFNIVEMFTADAEVITLASKIVPLTALYQISECLAAVTGGILRGQGRQKIAALCSLISYYLIAIPLGFWLAFGLDLGLLGLWIGLCISIFLISFLQLFSVLNSDWEAIISQSLQDALSDNQYSSDVRSVLSHLDEI
ncbi:Ethionine resistance-conferring protein 1 [Cyberlindnera fabianii]|uniref:Ethionine resistance-conferring protein 1 n=1 Tax=Cyberlindnera fabianii TaxID=36022 RepID=A0A1V2L662_CYBFA|nr:Ethionine resistance-conferring protein 1 [Cyberlindnera fabianii]